MGSNPIDSTSGGFKLPLLFLLLLFLLSTCFAEWSVVFDGKILDVALSMIESARWEILMASFGVDHPAIVKALKWAEERGVEVYIVTDEKTSCPLKHIVDARDDSLMHEKLLLVDREKALISTANFTRDGLEKGRNVALMVDDQKIVEAIVWEFSNFLHGRFSRDKVPVTVSGENWKISFTPGNDPLVDIKEIFKRAKRSIWLCSYAFTDPQITLLLKLMASRGLDVKVMLDASWCEENASGELELLNNGLQLRKFVGEGILHAKLVLVDGRWLILGSANFTRNARFRNDEVVVILEDPKIVLEVERWFMGIWEKLYEKARIAE